MLENIKVNAQSSIRIQEEKVFYFDPFQITEEAHDADFIFITHDHFDHLDFPSIEKIQNEKTVFIIPESCKESLGSDFLNNKILFVLPEKTYQIENLQINTIPSYNIDKPFHKREKNYVGYLLTINGNRIYVSGDTDNIKEAREITCDIAFVPIGGTYTMNFQEAAEFIHAIKPKFVIPTHYQTIVGSKKDAENFKKILDKEITCIIKM